MGQIRVTLTFHRSLARLPQREANLVKQTVYDVMASPELPGHRMHRIDLHGKKFWSISASMDLRIVAWREGDILTAMHVDHHDAAYRWANRWNLKKHEYTGAMQLVPDPALLAEDLGPSPPTAKPFFSDESEDYLLTLGVPREVLGLVRQVATTDQLHRLVDELPEEAGVALLELAEGQRPQPRPAPNDAHADPFAHPDARRRFWITSDEAVLAEILESPWEEWLIFLHPDQRDAVERSFKRPARISGAAGTGKTVVVLHRAARLAKAGGKVLLTTYSRTLATRLRHNMDRLLRGDPEARGRVEVSPLHRLAWARAIGGPKFRLVRYNDMRRLISEERGNLDPAVNDDFLMAEWDSVIDYRGINTLEAYEKAERIGRGTGLLRSRRRAIWDVFRRLRARMDAEGLITFADLCDRARAGIETEGLRPFEHVIVDEAQDFGPRELQLLIALAGSDRPDALCFAGDVGQRIYRWPFTWTKDLGINLRGSAVRLKVNYRTTDEIRRFSEALLPAKLTEIDEEETARDVRSLLRGSLPEMIACRTIREESQVLARWLIDLIAAGVKPGDIAIFGRIRHALRQRADPALREAKLIGEDLSDDESISSGTVALGTLHNAKGLEFRAVAVVGCDARLLPYKTEVDNTPETMRDVVIEKERNLLYVGCSRARESLLVTWSGQPSPFLILPERGH